MQINIVQTFINTASTSTNAKETTQSKETKDFNEVLNSERETSKPKTDEPKEKVEVETKEKNDETKTEDSSEILAVLLPNVQEILNNIKTQQAENANATQMSIESLSEQIMQTAGAEEGVEALLQGIANKNQKTSNENSEIKILDVSLLKTEAGIPAELMQKVNALAKSETENNETKSNLDMQNTNTQNIGIILNNVNTNNVSSEFATQNIVNHSMSAEYVSEINYQIANNIAMGNNDFTIQLSPENLGELTIKASFEDGKSIVSIICNDLKTLEIVQKSADDLALIMQNKTGNQTQVVVESPRSDYLDNQNEHKQDGNNQNHQNENQAKDEKENPQDFLQQLRLGLTQI